MPDEVKRKPGSRRPGHDPRPSGKQEPRRARREFLLEALEPRILLSADPIAEAVQKIRQHDSALLHAGTSVLVEQVRLDAQATRLTSSRAGSESSSHPTGSEVLRPSSRPEAGPAGASEWVILEQAGGSPKGSLESPAEGRGATSSMHASGPEGMKGLESWSAWDLSSVSVKGQHEAVSPEAISSDPGTASRGTEARTPGHQVKAETMGKELSEGPAATSLTSPSTETPESLGGPSTPSATATREGESSGEKGTKESSETQTTVQKPSEEVTEMSSQLPAGSGNGVLPQTVPGDSLARGPPASGSQNAGTVEQDSLIGSELAQAAPEGGAEGQRALTTQEASSLLEEAISRWSSYPLTPGP